MFHCNWWNCSFYLSGFWFHYSALFAYCYLPNVFRGKITVSKFEITRCDNLNKNSLSSIHSICLLPIIGFLFLIVLGAPLLLWISTTTKFDTLSIVLTEEEYRQFTHEFIMFVINKPYLTKQSCHISLCIIESCPSTTISLFLLFFFFFTLRGMAYNTRQSNAYLLHFTNITMYEQIYNKTEGTKRKGVMRN